MTTPEDGPETRIEALISAFKEDLDRRSDGQMVQRHVLAGSAYAIDDGTLFDLKQETATQFRVNPSEIFLVGSAKLGFTIKPQHSFRHFGDTSDLDLALVSGALFDEVWFKVAEYAESGGYFPTRSQFSEHLLHGWIRPDKLPPGGEFPYREEWWAFFNKLQASKRFGPYKIRMGLYKSFEFLENINAELSPSAGQPKMKTTATNRKIRVLLTALTDKSLVPNPTFQRRLVWSEKHKIAFLDTVLRGYPFPEIYIAAGEVDPDTAEGSEMLVDGQQRMTTLLQYFRGSLDLPYNVSVPKYSDMERNEKEAFLEYEVVVRDLGRVGIEELREVFQRINSTKYSLNAMEIQNARYDGAYKEFGDHLAQHRFFDQHRVFNASDIRRMHDIRLVLTLTATLLSGYFNRDSALEEFLEVYNDSFPPGQMVLHELEQVFRFIDDCSFDDRSRVWNKADLFTLIVELHGLMIRESRELHARSVGPNLSAFYAQVADESLRHYYPEAAVYYKAAVQATNDRSSRLVRAQIVNDIIRRSQNRLALD